VVLVLGNESADASRETASSVRHYLEAIRVPFFVWSLKKPSSQPLAAAWAPVEDVSSFDKLDQAVSRLKEALAEQHIVWLEGRYLPQNISIAEGAVGVALVK